MPSHPRRSWTLDKLHRLPIPRVDPAPIAPHLPDPPFHARLATLEPGDARPTVGESVYANLDRDGVPVFAVVEGDPLAGVVDSDEVGVPRVVVSEDLAGGFSRLTIVTETANRDGKAVQCVLVRILGGGRHTVQGDRRVLQRQQRGRGGTESGGGFTRCRQLERIASSSQSRRPPSGRRRGGGAPLLYGINLKSGKKDYLFVLKRVRYFTIRYLI